MADTDRVVVVDAIRDHEEQLKEMRGSLGSEAAEADDVTLLRYLLSHNKTEAAVQAFREAAKERARSPLYQKARELVASLPEGDSPSYDQWLTHCPGPVEVWRKHLAGGIHKTTAHGAPLCFIRAGLTDLGMLMDECVSNN